MYIPIPVCTSVVYFNVMLFMCVYFLFVLVDKINTRQMRVYPDELNIKIKDCPIQYPMEIAFVIQSDFLHN